jgi:hypothetical protein
VGRRSDASGMRQHRFFHTAPREFFHSTVFEPVKNVILTELRELPAGEILTRRVS